MPKSIKASTIPQRLSGKPAFGLEDTCTGRSPEPPRGWRGAVRGAVTKVARVPQLIRNIIEDRAGEQ